MSRGLPSIQIKTTRLTTGEPAVVILPPGHEPIVMPPEDAERMARAILKKSAEAGKAGWQP